MVDNFGLVGAGGLGREVMDWAIEELTFGPSAAGRVYFVETQPSMLRRNGITLMSLDDFLALDGENSFAVAVADSDFRDATAKIFDGVGLNAASLAAPTAQVSGLSSIGRGAIVGINGIVSPDSRVGDFFVGNNNFYVAHDVVVGDFVTFGPGVICCGHVDIADHVSIGAGAVIRPGTAQRRLSVGRGAVIGAGAVVVSDVEDFSIVVGNPAKPLDRNP